MCHATDAVMFELPNTVEAPSAARALVDAHLCPAHGRDALGAAQVVVSELATCAVLYGKPPIVLDLDCAVTGVRIAVTHQAVESTVADIPVDEAGGLRSAVLSKLTRSWGIERRPKGRTLWSLLPTAGLPPRSARALSTRGGPPV